VLTCDNNATISVLSLSLPEVRIWFVCIVALASQPSTAHSRSSRNAQHKALPPIRHSTAESAVAGAAGAAGAAAAGSAAEPAAAASVCLIPTLLTIIICGLYVLRFICIKLCYSVITL